MWPTGVDTGPGKNPLQQKTRAKWGCRRKEGRPCGVLWATVKHLDFAECHEIPIEELQAEERGA